MSTIIIGLDLGNDAVKAAVLKSSGRKAELLGIHHRRVMTPESEQDEFLMPIEDPLATITQTNIPIGSLSSSDVLSLASSDMLQALGVGGEAVPEQEVDEAPSIEITDEEAYAEEEEIVAPAGPFPPQVIEAARDLLQAINEPSAQVVVAVPGQRISTWMVDLPFSDARTVAKVLPGELATQVPFPMDDMVLDWRTLQSDDESSRVLAAQVPKEDVRALLDELEFLSVDPRHICVDSFVLGRLVGAVELDKGDCVAVVDLGRKRTLLNVSRAGETLMVRAIDRGGDDVTSLIAEMQELDRSVAEENKRLGVSVDDMTSTGRAVAGAIDPLLAGLRATLMSFETSGAGEIGRMYLCGGGARIEGIAARFEDALGVPTFMLPRSDVLGRDDPDVPPEHALALALGVSGLPNRSATILDLRLGEFAYRRDTRRRQAAVLLALAAVLLFGLFSVGDYVIKRGKLAGQSAAYEEEIIGMVKLAAPDLPEERLKTITAPEAMNIVLAEVEKLKVAGPIGEDFGARSPLFLLKRLSEVIPKEITIDVDEYRVDDEGVRMQCRTESFAMADQLMNILGTTLEFAKAEKADQVRDRDGNTRFTVSIPWPQEEGI